jgi:hypothetical protein
VALSDALEQLAEQARAIEQNVREAEADQRAQLEAKAAEARKTADEHAEQVRSKEKGAAEGAARSWARLQHQWDEHVARLRRSLDEAKANLDVTIAAKRAESAELDAMDAIDFATSALDEAQYAVLNAEILRMEADQLAAS